MIVYVDSLLFLNFVVNYLLLLSAVKITGCVFSRPRLLAAAAFGAGYALAVLLPGMQFMVGAAGKVLAGSVMVIIAFGLKRHTVRLGLIVIGVSLAFGGAAIIMSTINESLYADWNLVYVPLDIKTLLVVTGVAYGVLGFVYKKTASRLKSRTGQAVITALGRTKTVSCLLDTGNSLCDPNTNQPVTIVNKEVFASFFPMLKPARLSDPTEAFTAAASAAPEARLRLIPYSSVGVGSGLLLAMKCDSVTIDGKTIKGGLIAASPNDVSDNGSYEAIGAV